MSTSSHIQTASRRQFLGVYAIALSAGPITYLRRGSSR